MLNHGYDFPSRQIFLKKGIKDITIVKIKKIKIYFPALKLQH